MHDDENISANISTASTNRSISQDTPRPGNFKAWFNANKDDLKSTNPGALDPELHKIGMKMYKELTKQQKMPSYDEESKAELLTSQRKLDLKDSEAGASSKLAKYMLNK